MPTTTAIATKMKLSRFMAFAQNTVLFFCDNYATLTASVLAELFEFVESKIVDQDAVEEKLDNALSTCFLENISSEPCGEAAKSYMGRKTRTFFDRLHVEPPY